ncbi:hypothetical protein A3Q56_08546 [Intoshia linei]|uniref:Uncharacterized protein n=1 Tax=Intoshia linei TaxID=1819745 RepID=A0A177ANY1_9BILA|nr:hypothetical protein A3Q56_08546 [Intoshia linei]
MINNIPSMTFYHYIRQL